MLSTVSEIVAIAWALPEKGPWKHFRFNTYEYEADPEAFTVPLKAVHTFTIKTI